ncbi:hypothetical protein PHYBLDRAFT_162375 [Phycomyces blakesleeanus NRRL 1555(-)]|uniref:Arrestin C-terminal-like domain-containing protein n=1 Tax=Phycomyces blakesleeanus (strain ATCC 8743b / DSM 1359 / FGSC 10004 / NBRC 33097 / NRRL 1555) TaxID=763407 RepID=A0A167Q955_PHYB8|nr:hypothetical protein PHYBLDRAFT_162375 [Phycomyces blakesleeanus NRRL 1555(-)]OAD79298.1 hypothetical protein PHYBLDRAFT_162375 [Phycomyces blakesleeanus NRRL 1555(-)]|eukprot:XP_018297338.1 hypothetical protein PHYBLDRAFT_162375 [Phycomyces blakesleeanus NRRL 1555(-)]
MKLNHLDLKINVETPRIILRGALDESVGCVLRGFVVFCIKETIRVKSLKLRLSGRMRINCTERVLSCANPRQHKREISVIENEWVFLELAKKCHVLIPDTYRYPFEFVIPGDAPESVKDHCYGSLLYKLKAVAERPGLLTNLVDRQPLDVIRQDNDQDNDMPIQMVNLWQDQMELVITAPRKKVYLGEHVSIDFFIKPLGPGFQVRYISWFLKEYTSFQVDDNTIEAEPKIIRFHRDDQGATIDPYWQKTEVVFIPHSADAVRCDTTSGRLKIEHKVKCTVSVVDEEGHVHDLRVSLPLVIAEVRQEEDEEDLPTYEHAIQTEQYSPTPCTVSSIPAYTAIWLAPQAPDGQNPTTCYTLNNYLNYFKILLRR